MSFVCQARVRDCDRWAQQAGGMQRLAPTFSIYYTHLCSLVTEEGEDDNSVFIDTTMLGILGLLALMFLVICVVLQMFAK